MMDELATLVSTAEPQGGGEAGTSLSNNRETQMSRLLLFVAKKKQLLDSWTWQTTRTNTWS